MGIAVNDDHGFPGPGSGERVGKAEDSGPYNGDVEPGALCVWRIQAPVFQSGEEGPPPGPGSRGWLVDQKPAETVK